MRECSGMYEMHPEMNTIEKEIVLTIIEDALKHGYTITVYDGVENVIEKSTSREDIFSALFSTDEDTLFFFGQDGQHVGWILLVYGNRECVVSDYGDNPAMDTLLQHADTLAEKYS